MSIIPDPASHFEDGSSKNASDGRDPATGRFLDGNRKGSPGRKKGARARWSEDFMADVEEAWKEMGAAAIRRALFTDPAGSIRALIGILPKHAKLEVTTNLDDIPDDVLEQMVLYAEARAAELKTIEGKAVDVTPKALAAPAPPSMGVAPPTSAEQKAEALRRDLNDQHDALAAKEPVAPDSPLPYPVGRVVSPSDRDVERRNVAKLHDDGGEIDPASLF